MVDMLSLSLVTEENMMSLALTTTIKSFTLI